MNWKVEKGTEADAGKIAEFQIDMALESEGAILDRDKILNGVRTGLSDPAKGTYYISEFFKLLYLKVVNI